MKKFYLLFFTIVSFVGAMAQVNYTFTATTGTYTAISGTTVTLTATSSDGGSGGLDEGFNGSVPIGFNFSYNGATAVSNIGVTTNGFLYLGTTAFPTTGNTFYNNNLTSGFTAQRPFIAPLWDDLFVGSIQYTTTGSAPNRIFTIQWDNVNWDYSAATPAVAFQVKLYETTNLIEFIYNNLGGAIANTSGGASIGLAATATGSGNFMSLSNSGAAPTTSSSTETSTISTAPASGQIYRFTPVAQAANDVAVDVVYALGKAGKNTTASVRAYVKNIGTGARTNVPVTLTVTGANSYTTTFTIPSLAAGAGGTVTFTGFPLTNTGTNTLTVTVPSDDVNGNNTAVATQDVTVSEQSYAQGTTMTGGVNVGQNGFFAAKFSVPYGNTVNQVQAYFNAASITYDVFLYNRNASGTPATILWSQTGLTSTSGLNTINVSPVASVTDTFFVAIKQTGTSLALGYQLESPLRSNAFFFSSNGTSWSDMGPSTVNTFRLMLGATTTNALPVVLSQFNGERQGATNLLKWITSSEANNRGFDVERSVDGKNYSTIAFVTSKGDRGNSNTSLSYNIIDEKPFSGATYYRLKQVDNDGRFSYSNTVILKGDKPSSITISAAYPNPTRDQLSLVISTGYAGKATVSIIDVTGKTLQQFVSNLILGDNQLQINTSSLALGAYYIRLTDEKNQVISSQFIKN